MGDNNKMTFSHFSNVYMVMELNIKVVATENPDVYALTSGLPTKLVWTTLRSCFKSLINEAARDL